MILHTCYVMLLCSREINYYVTLFKGSHEHKISNVCNLRCDMGLIQAECSHYGKRFLSYYITDAGRQLQFVTNNK
jgi:hypothetical protein